MSEQLKFNKVPLTEECHACVNGFIDSDCPCTMSGFGPVNESCERCDGKGFLSVKPCEKYGCNMGSVLTDEGQELLAFIKWVNDRWIS
jgi:hypothetical protein